MYKSQTNFLSVYISPCNESWKQKTECDD